MCSQVMKQSMRSMICLVEIMLHVRDAKRKLQKREINTLVENANSHDPSLTPFYKVGHAVLFLFFILLILVNEDNNND